MKNVKPLLMTALSVIPILAACGDQVPLGEVEQSEGNYSADGGTGSETGTEPGPTAEAGSDSGSTPAGCHGWCVESSVGRSDYYYFGLWCAAADDCYAVGQEARLMHWNGSTWTQDPLAGVPVADITTSAGARLNFYGVRGTGPNDVWLVGDLGLVLHFDGTSWSTVQPAYEVFPNRALMGIYASSPTNAWFVGDFGTIVHWTEGAGLWYGWQQGTPNTVALSAVWGSGSDDIWAVGEFSRTGAGGRLRHWNGSFWTTENLGAFAFYGVHGFASNDVWAVGGAGQIGHYDGTSWQTLPGPTNMVLESVWGPAPNDVWAVSTTAITIHYDGSTWSQVSVAASAPGDELRALHGAGGAMRAVGHDKIYRWVP